MTLTNFVSTKDCGGLAAYIGGLAEDEVVLASFMVSPKCTVLPNGDTAAFESTPYAILSLIDTLHMRSIVVLFEDVESVMLDFRAGHDFGNFIIDDNYVATECDVFGEGIRCKSAWLATYSIAEGQDISFLCSLLEKMHRRRSA